MQPETSPIDAGDGRPGAAPPVVAVVVTRGGSHTLGDSLAALAAQEYRNLTTVVVAAGTGSITADVAEIAPDAFVRPAPEATTATEAANIGAAAVEGATFLLFCHDDVALAPGAVQAMVTEAFRANAGVVGPKLVDWEHPDVLRSVGTGIDKFGEPVPVAEPGELDQSQHDGAREVFVVPSAAMLVRADLFADLGGFSAGLSGSGADLDLCWRARIAGAHVVVMPSAVGRHAESSPFADDRREADRLAIRQQARAVLTCYSLRHLLRVLPQAVLLSLLDLLASVVTGRFRRAMDIVSAWGWNVGHLGSAVGARGRIRRSRRVPDSEIRPLQARGSARIAGAFRSFRGDGRRRVPDALAAARELPASWQSETVTAGIVLFAVLGAVYVLGSRQLIAEGIPAIRDLLPFGRPTALAGEWWSGWRDTGIAHGGPAPLGFPLLGLGHFVLLGSDGLLRTLVLLGAMPMGTFGAWRLLRGVADVRARVVTALAYAFVALPYDAMGEGRWTILVTYAVMPFVLRRLAVASGVEPFDDAPRPVTEGLRLALPLTLAATFAPAAAVVSLGVAGVVAAVLVAFRRREAGGRVAVAGGVAVLATAVVLFPTTIDLVRRSDRWVVLWASTPTGRPKLSEILRLTTGTSPGGVLWYAVPIAAVLVLVVGRTWRFRWGTVGWALAFASWALVLLGDRWWPGDPHPAVGLVLVPAAAGLSMAVALGVESFSVDVLGGAFGWKQAIASLAGLVAALSVVPFLAASLDGRWSLPDSDAVAATSALEDPGAPASRTLWIGQPDVVPTRTTRLDSGVGYAAVEHVEPTISFIHPARAGERDDELHQALESAFAGGSSRLGAELARFGVRYVVVVTSLTADSDEVRSTAVADIRHTLAQQMDLRSVDVAPGLDVYRNSEFHGSATLTHEIDDRPTPSGVHVVAIVVQLLALVAVVRVARSGIRRESNGDDPVDGSSPPPSQGPEPEPEAEPAEVGSGAV